MFMSQVNVINIVWGNKTRPEKLRLLNGLKCISNGFTAHNFAIIHSYLSVALLTDPGLLSLEISKCNQRHSSC